MRLSLALAGPTISVKRRDRALNQANTVHVYFTIWTINICLLTFFKALLNIIGGKGAISNINYYHLYINNDLQIL